MMASARDRAPEARFWDKAAEKYAAQPVGDVAAYERTLERTRAYLKPQDRVLEIGCGTGTTALKLADAAGSILATDISPAMIEIAERKRVTAGAANVSFEPGDVFDARLTEGEFDVVAAFNLLHLVDDAESALRRARALLKPGGVLISKTVCLRRRAWLYGPMIAALRLFGKAPKVRFFSISELDELVRAAGFEIVETGVFPVSMSSRFIVARKTS